MKLSLTRACRGNRRTERIRRSALSGAGQIGATLTRRFTALAHRVFVANSRAPEPLAALARETIGLPDQSVTLMFAVGNTGNQSLNLLNRTIRDVF